MARFLCILITAYNFKIVTTTWALFSHYIFKIVGIPIGGSVSLVFIIGVIIFMTIHSIKLVMLNFPARKTQIIISAINPAIHILLIVLVMLNMVPPDKAPPLNALLVTRSLFTFLDLVVVFYMSRNGTIEIFKLATESRAQVKKMKQAANA